MEKEEKKLQVHIHEGVNIDKPIEIILREGIAPRAIEQLPTKAPESISIVGIIDTPLQWLEKRIDTIDQKTANVTVNRDKMTITLTINESDGYHKNTFTGTVRLSETFEKFGINNEQKSWQPVRLGQFLRINRSVFFDREKCMAIVSALKNFTANAKSEIQRQRDPSGSMSDVYRSHVESNLPKSFEVYMPIFKGGARQGIDIEFDHYVSDGDVHLMLVSPGANELIEIYRDNCLNSVLDGIRAIAPEIPIIEV
jgi:hypothetical protein